MAKFSKVATPVVALLATIVIFIAMFVSVPTAQGSTPVNQTTAMIDDSAKPVPPRPAPRASRAQIRAAVFPNLHKASPARSKAYAKFYINWRYKWGYEQFKCLVPLWERESGWTYNSYDPAQGNRMAGGVRRTWGIPQANPGTKMASEGKDWRTNTATQIRWGAKYIKKTYKTPCNALAFWNNHHWY